MKIPFSFVLPLAAASTAVQTPEGYVGESHEFHIQTFSAEINAGVFSGYFNWNFRIFTTQNYFFYSDLPDTAFGKALEYMPFSLLSEVVIPPHKNLEFRVVPLQTFTAGQLVLNGYLKI